MKNINNMADGITEENIKEEIESLARRNLPFRISDDVILKDMFYDNHVVSLYYVFDEKGRNYNLQKLAEEIKKRRISGLSDLRDQKDEKAYEFFKRAEIKQRIVVKGNSSGNVAETYITLREIEDAIRYK